MTTITKTYKTHTEWLNDRGLHIGSSDIPTLLGVNPYCTPYQLWLEKTGQVPKEEVETPLMRAGHLLEDAVATLCAEEAELEIIKSSRAEFVVIDKDRPYLAVSPDRYAWRKGLPHTRDNKVIVECKTTQNDIDPENIPLYWFVQVMYQLGVCQMDSAAIAWLVRGGVSFGYRWLQRDEDFYKGIILEAVERFWKDNIQGGQEPALSSLQDVVLKYPSSKVGKRLAATPEILDKYEELKATNAELKRLQSVKDDIEGYIKQQMKDAEEVTDGDNLLFTWRSSAPGQKFNADAFKAEHEDIYKKYLVPTQTRRFYTK